MQLRQALRTAVASLQEHHVPSAQLAAELVLMHILGSDRSYLYTHPESELGSDVVDGYFGLVAERSTGKPTQYITGHQDFWGLDFEVTPDVLIPRPETEHLVEAVVELAKLPRHLGGSSGAQSSTSALSLVTRHSSLVTGPQFQSGRGPRIVDVGTGSGCIALALASELAQAEVFATDVSRPALRVAHRNAARLGLADRIGLVETDLLSGLSAGARFDFVVSNPPYVRSDELECVQREVRDFEPRIAWADSGDGEPIYKRLFSQAQCILRPGGYVVVEVGYNQAERVRALLKDGWIDSEVRPDLAGIPRVVFARKSGH